MLYKKLVEIGKSYGYNQNNLADKLKTSYAKRANTFVQNKIKTIAQENLFMLNRLLGKKSEYDKSKFQREFETNQRYKSNACNYPSINFFKTNTRGPIIESYDYSKVKSLTDTSIFPPLTGNKINKAKSGSKNKLNKCYYR